MWVIRKQNVHKHINKSIGQYERSASRTKIKELGTDPTSAGALPSAHLS